MTHTPRTPDTRNLLKSSHALSSKSSATGTRQGRSAANLPNDDSEDEMLRELKRKQSRRNHDESEHGRRSSVGRSKKDDES